MLFVYLIDPEVRRWIWLAREINQSNCWKITIISNSVEGRENNSIPPLNVNSSSSTDLNLVPSISKQMDKILNSHKMNIIKGSKRPLKYTNKYRSPLHLKLKSISGEAAKPDLNYEGIHGGIIRPQRIKNPILSNRNELPALNAIAE